MPINFVSGDPLLTRAQTLAFGYNAKGKTETTLFITRLLDRAPAAFATYAKQCRSGQIRAGGLWLWSEMQPNLLFLPVRESAGSSTRPRHIETALLTIARDYRLYGLKSIAVAALADPLDWPAIKPIVIHWLARCPLPVVVYENIIPGVLAEAES
ncbi:MAG: hypothetical protein H6671_05495 [Anaerolineaceae bacterium]|nr:hypothetical protein [Anaerolineaceae bacterium]